MKAINGTLENQKQAAINDDATTTMAQDVKRTELAVIRVYSSVAIFSASGNKSY